MSNNPKRHHYLPESYLNNFSRDGKGLWVYDIEKDQLRSQTIRDTCNQSYYYCSEDKDGNRSFEVEKQLAGVEGVAKTIIRDKVEKRLPIDEDEKDNLSVFIALQRLRTPDFQSDVEHISEFMIRKIMRTTSTKDNIQEFLDAEEKRTGKKSTAKAAEIEAIMKNDEYGIKIRREHSLGMMLSLIPKTADWIGAYEWDFICTDEKDPFVTTDSPFLIEPPRDWPKNSFYSGVGLGIKGATKYMPLSAHTCLMMRDPGPRMGYKQATSQVVRYINCWETSRAYRFVVGPTEELLRTLVAEVKKEKAAPGNSWGGSKLEIVGHRRKKNSKGNS